MRYLSLNLASAALQLWVALRRVFQAPGIPIDLFRFSANKSRHHTHAWIRECFSEEGKMEANTIRCRRLAKKLTPFFELKSHLDTVLSVCMVFLNRFMESERSSIFLFQPAQKQLTVFTSLDLEKHEICIPKSCGLTGWVFEHGMPVMVNHAYEDGRFYRGVDDMTGFHTRSMICTPLIDRKGRCLGTLQSLNKLSGNFTIDDLELLDLPVRMMADAINGSLSGQQACQMVEHG